MDEVGEEPLNTNEPPAPVSVRLESKQARYGYACQYGKQRTAQGDIPLYGVGLEFEPVHREITHIYPGTAADRCRRVVLGDRIVQVQGMPDMSHWISNDHTDEVRAAMWGRQGSRVWLTFARGADDFRKVYSVELIRGDKSFIDLLIRRQRENEEVEARIPKERPVFELSSQPSCFERLQLQNPDSSNPGDFDAFKWLKEAKIELELERTDAEAARRRREEREKGRQLEAALEERLQELQERLAVMPVPDARLVLAEPGPIVSLPDMEHRHALRMEELGQQQLELEGELAVLKMCLHREHHLRVGVRVP